MQKVMNTASLVVLAAALGGSFGAAQAADLSAAPVYTKAPVVEEWNPWMIRVRAVGVLPDGNSTVHVLESPTFGTLLDSPRSGLKFSDTVVPEVDVSYFFTRNLAVEAVMGVPPRATITGTGLLGGLPVGKASAFSPVVTFQYHFTNLGAFKPYIGAGVNYTSFYNVKAGNQTACVAGALTGPIPGMPCAAGLPATITHLSIGDSFGPVIQFGFDYMIDRHWGINVDVKRIWMRPEFSTIVAQPLTGTNPSVGTAHVDPWAGGRRNLQVLTLVAAPGNRNLSTFVMAGLVPAIHVDQHAIMLGGYVYILASAPSTC